MQSLFRESIGSRSSVGKTVRIAHGLFRTFAEVMGFAPFKGFALRMSVE
jgi:hypothetical protein